MCALTCSILLFGAQQQATFSIFVHPSLLNSSQQRFCISRHSTTLRRSFYIHNLHISQHTTPRRQSIYIHVCTGYDGLFRTGTSIRELHLFVTLKERYKGHNDLVILIKSNLMSRRCTTELLNLLLRDVNHPCGKRMMLYR